MFAVVESLCTCGIPRSNSILSPPLALPCAPRTSVCKVPWQRNNHLPHIVRALRPHHWSKNLLVFSAVFIGGHPFESGAFPQALLAFIAFSLCASAAYLVNDVLDIEADRLHPIKRNRPFAAGSLPTTWALPLAALSLGLGLLAARGISRTLYGLSVALRTRDRPLLGLAQTIVCRRCRDARIALLTAACCRRIRMRNPGI